MDINPYRRIPSAKELAAYNERRAAAAATRNGQKPLVIIFRDSAFAPSYVEYYSPRDYRTAQEELHPLALPVDAPIILADINAHSGLIADILAKTMRRSQDGHQIDVASLIAAITHPDVGCSVHDGRTFNPPSPFRIVERSAPTRIDTSRTLWELGFESQDDCDAPINSEFNKEDNV